MLKSSIKAFNYTITYYWWKVPRVVAFARASYVLVTYKHDASAVEINPFFGSGLHVFISFAQLNATYLLLLLFCQRVLQNTHVCHWRSYPYITNIFIWESEKYKQNMYLSYCFLLFVLQLNSMCWYFDKPFIEWLWGFNKKKYSAICFNVNKLL